MCVNPGLGAKKNLLVAPIAAAILLFNSQKLASLSHGAIENYGELATNLRVVKYLYRLQRFEGLVSVNHILAKAEYLLSRARPA